jgi:HK97 family phage portal protein
VKPKQDPDYTVWYEVDGVRREARDILHVAGLSFDGFAGVSVATYARETLGLAMATEAHGARLFSAGALFRGILQHPGKLKDDKAARRMRESFDEAFRGDGAHQTALLEEGVKYEKIGMTAEDSQFLGTREFQAHEIARWFRMPPHKVGLLDKATFSNIEHQALEYVVDTLLPWLVRWEQRCSVSLLSKSEQDEYFFEFLVDGLLRGDQAARYKAYKDAVLTGFMSRNEVRAKENLNPEPGLDEFLTPLNMAAAGQDDDR